MNAKPPKVLSVRRDGGLNRALGIIRKTGMSDTDATKWAMTIAANILELAWVNGHEELGVVPDMRVSYRVKGPV
ncbi:hypothetical protein SAMN04487981_10233 [Streptomyces sp. cf386]|uniref:hypothetical protein n=1 Tax=Streptomyces sp. cf386 TaxID=1761904 RepID=UPI00088EBD27|nr:hypothetical protein [Streptomyces sp. cf386]SDM62572.1 hypothetical protein SAMN04487981_10233 [Streptomyces sp. cf386]